ncbi:putative E3 ubiquitin-protein ligase UBR7 [Lampris incognitus]|uniref:putative E3 ubiquitin-protein ligase UBR7 n=1 Tax=Lampris incognitus TaxID=2546036 RepID=UPI0024B4D1A2|nr:putative E3 ubiquitin-protein ligase UBR7 [Lampris incognitus]
MAHKTSPTLSSQPSLHPGLAPPKPRPLSDPLQVSDYVSPYVSGESLEDVILDADDIQEVFSLLAGSDPVNCSYPQGYVNRKAVFACSTCTPRFAKPAGICPGYACAEKCHNGHDIYELYTKRNFCCDCGNDKFGDFQCKLFPVKDSQNVKNLYSHNSHGTYCLCDRPYPDTDDNLTPLVNDEMIQCIICEDWFHTRHLGCPVVDSEELQEMVCEACMNKAPFLWTYAAHIAAPPLIKASPCGEEVELTVDKDKKKCDPCENVPEGSTSSLGCQSEQKEAAHSSYPRKRSHQEVTDEPVKAKAVACRLRELQAQGPVRPREGAVFWPYNWRSQICTCVSCKRAYVEVGVQFLLDESDTVLAYENRGIMKPFGNDLLTSFLSSINRVEQLEMIYYYNGLKTRLESILQDSANDG